MEIFLTVGYWRVILVSMKRKLSPHTARRLSHARRLRWILEFAQRDLTRLRPGDWLNLRGDVHEVLVGAEYSPNFDFGFDAAKIPAPDGFMAYPVEPPYPQDFPEEAFQRLQEETWTILHDMVLGARKKSAPAVPPVPLHVALRVTNLLGLEAKPGLPFLIAEGPMRDVFLWLVFMLLQDGAAFLAQCPECSRVFYRNRNQDYCSRPCTNQVSQRLWHERHAATSASTS